MRAHFIHITDAHLDDGTIRQGNVENKAGVPDAQNPTRSEAMRTTLAHVCDRLNDKTIKVLDGVIISGDVADRGSATSHVELLAIVSEAFESFGITASKIIVVPGNHDVHRGSLPSTDVRYKNFLAWRDAGCVTPWLKNLESPHETPHHLFASDKSWLIVPINSSNWSQTTRQLEEPLKSIWSTLHTSGVKRADREKVRKQLDELIAYDITRVGGEELDYLTRQLRIWAQGVQEPILRIGVMHHQLLSPSMREELRPFADPTNLVQIRSFLGEQKFDLILHGHKHGSAVYYDYFRPDGGMEPRRAAIVSGGSITAESGVDVVRLLTINGMPFTPSLEIEQYAVPVPGSALRTTMVGPFDLWNYEGTTPGQPVVIHGTNIDEAYERAQTITARDPRPSTLIVHLDLPQNGNELPIPSTYKVAGIEDDDARKRWLTELVDWWQEPQSSLQHRIPQAHGARLHRFGGKIDQIERIGRLLHNGQTTKAVAVLIDPFIDFDRDDVRFASFCLVQFTRRKVKNGNDEVDCIAYYRAQEFVQWWPINVAELRVMQIKIGQSFGGLPGRITTIAADPRPASLAPTQAIVPSIDRWVDRNPERIFLLANALLARRATGAMELEVVAEWRQLLQDLLSTTVRFSMDGMPTSVDGLKALRTFLLARGPANGDIAAVAQALELLADANHAWEKSKREIGNFDDWKGPARIHLSALHELTERLLSAEPRQA